MKDEKDWDFICVPVNPRQLGIIEKFYEDTKGQQYDWVGMIASQIVPFHIKHKSGWYCSEWIAYALRLAGILDTLHGETDMSPAVLSNLLPMAVRYKNYADILEGMNWTSTWAQSSYLGPTDANK
jgi:hypothetical protein